MFHLGSMQVCDNTCYEMRTRGKTHWIQKTMLFAKMEVAIDVTGNTSQLSNSQQVPCRF